MGVPIPPLDRTVPTGWTEADPALALPAGPDLRTWWTAFNDPMLDALVDQALAQNLTLAEAGSRVRQARQLAQGVTSSFLPSLSAGTRSVQPPSAQDTYLQGSLDAIWDLGLFGAREGATQRYRGGIDLALADEQAARVTVVAEVVRHYLDLRAAQAQLAQAQAQLQLDERSLALVDARIDQRLAGRGDRDAVVLRQARTRAALADPLAAQAAAAHSLAALLGQTRPDPAWLSPSAQPSLAVRSIVQLPADLLRVRPDIRRAEADVAQAAGDLGIARSELYPRVALGASYLVSYNLTRSPRSRFNTGVAAGPIIDIPLFDWGRRQAGAAAKKEALDAAVTAYRQTVLDGVAEVETALAALQFQTERVTQLEAARQTMARQRATHQSLVGLGLASEFDGLDNQQGALAADQDLVLAQARRNLAFVTLYKALGGAPLPVDEAAALQPNAAARLPHDEAAS
jgi:multidrug efflux system outer membrane protein